MMATRDGDFLDFVVRFVRMDLVALRRGDRLNLHDELSSFLEHERPIAPGVWGHVSRRPFPERYPDAALRRLHRETRRFLETIVRGHATQASALNIGEAELAEVRHLRVDYVVWSGNRSGPHPLAVNLMGGTRDVFMSALVLALAERPGTILGCPECDQIFYRVRKQRYCSRACANRSSVKRFRRRHARGGASRAGPGPT